MVKNLKRLSIDDIFESEYFQGYLKNVKKEDFKKCEEDIANRIKKLCTLNQSVNNIADDLYQSGLIGLLQAAKKYDKSKSSFRTYARKYLNGQIEKMLRTHYNKFYVSKYGWIQMKSIINFINEKGYGSNYNEAINVYSKERDLNIAYVRRLVCTYLILTSVVSVNQEEKGGNLLNSIKIEPKEFKEIEKNELVNLLKKSLKKMEAEKVKVFFEAYGIGCEKLYLKEIEEKYDISSKEIKEINKAVRDILKEDLKKLYSEEEICTFFDSFH